MITYACFYSMSVKGELIFIAKRYGEQNIRGFAVADIWIIP